ncbi:MAG: hypothetical protein IMY72_12855 [Bacteroidetes bacterium]|nr:hypothetical protein [Bacteroidota bacterium]
MTSFLKFILVFVIVFYLIKILFRYFIKKFLNNYNNNSKDNFAKQEKKEGNITVENSEQKKTYPKDMGEYVDYEEVDE